MGRSDMDFAVVLFPFGTITVMFRYPQPLHGCHRQYVQARNGVSQKEERIGSDFFDEGVPSLVHVISGSSCGMTSIFSSYMPAGTSIGFILSSLGVHCDGPMPRNGGIDFC